jgi:hypothetical protein
MVHCGYEPSAVDHTFSSVGGLLANAKALLFSSYRDEGAAKLLEEEARKPHGPLVQLGISAKQPEQKREMAGAV